MKLDKIRAQTKALKYYWLKPILCVSGMKLLKVGINHTEDFFLQALVSNFSFVRKMLTSKECKHPSFSFSIEKFMFWCLDDKHVLNLYAWSREEKSANMSLT